MSDDDLDESSAGPLPSSSGGLAYYEEEFIDVDQTITGLLASLNLEQVRHRRTTDEDDELLRVTHQRIHAVIAREQDFARRRRLRRALPPSNCVREQIFYLRRLPHGSVPAPSYYPRLFGALDCIVKESFDEEYRKVAIILGLVESLAELLVLELAVFEIPSRNEHRSLRKLIANALTNLTYGHAASKRRLCFYSGFIPTVVRIINEARNLAQVYAGLIRNLSWMADGKMSDILSPTAKALSRAAVIAHNERDESCVRAILSALWNLASHSERNKKAICDEHGFLPLLTSLLSNDARMTAVVESASGILKYVSQYLSTNSSHLSARPEIAAHLVQLLSSASFTIVANTLGALANLIAKDPHLQSLVRHDVMAMNQLNVLRNSAREDIRAAVKAVLNHLNQPVGYTRYADMSSSLGCDPICSPRDTRLLALRGVRMSPGAVTGIGPTPSFDHRSSSLPRHFNRGGFVSSHASPHHGFPARGPISSGPALGFAPPPTQYIPDEDTPIQPSIVPDEITGDPNLEDSVRCTRSVSAASLGSELPNTSMGWQSNLDTAANSNRMSPVSPSDLPDSPTQCAKMMETKGDTSTPLSVKVRGGSGVTSSEPKSGLTASDTATAIVDDQPTPTFPAFVLPAPLPPASFPSIEKTDAEIACQDLADDLYAAVSANCVDGADLLARSIEAELPQPSPRAVTPKQQRRLADDRLLADMIEAAQPSPRRARHGYSDAHHSPNVDADRLLSACIDAAMPQPSPSFKSSSKNEKGGHGCFPVTHRVRPSPQVAGHPVSVEDFEGYAESSTQTTPLKSNQRTAHLPSRFFLRSLSILAVYSRDYSSENNSPNTNVYLSHVCTSENGDEATVHARAGNLSLSLWQKHGNFRFLDLQQRKKYGNGVHICLMWIVLTFWLETRGGLELLLNQDSRLVELALLYRTIVTQMDRRPSNDSITVDNEIANGVNAVLAQSPSITLVGRFSETLIDKSALSSVLKQLRCSLEKSKKVRLVHLERVVATLQNEATSPFWYGLVEWTAMMKVQNLRLQFDIYAF
ncbi:unnamed protein product [Cylicocyclus nassatus]|uniref:Uncharacterized protein n=1 Tax=Cylicocyclus nassatus TaxID=53992 RepID=A0AA36GLU4_CYLNA|nr:unnamed protein product [Cylicocyclus nassatus]